MIDRVDRGYAEQLRVLCDAEVQLGQLVKALLILSAYMNDKQLNRPIRCHAGGLHVNCETEDVMPADRTRLEQLGFGWYEDEGCWISYRHGF